MKFLQGVYNPTEATLTVSVKSTVHVASVTVIKSGPFARSVLLTGLNREAHAFFIPYVKNQNELLYNQLVCAEKLPTLTLIDLL
jgi:hypothetical protein